MKNVKYYVGLDIGTDSVGYAVTDNNYKLCKFKGNSMWGVTLFDEAQTARLEALADEFDLLRSGGSDFHGGTKPCLSLGTGKGNLKIPAQYYFYLKARKKMRLEEKI